MATAFFSFTGSVISPGDNPKINGFKISGKSLNFCHLTNPPEAAVGATEYFLAALENSSMDLIL